MLVQEEYMFTSKFRGQRSSHFIGRSLIEGAKGNVSFGNVSKIRFK